MEVVARVQAHPSRHALHSALLEALQPLPSEIILHSSEPPDPWAGYKLCLSDLPECSHVLIIQDDAQPCPNFSQAIYKVAESNPHNPVCLFLGSVPASTAGKARQILKSGKSRYVPLLNAPFMPLVAVLWPRAKAQEFLHWSNGSSRITRADDGNAARWMIRTKQQILVTVPSLVEHNDFVSSVKGGRDHKPGAESWRRALFLAEDGLNYEW